MNHPEPYSPTPPIVQEKRRTRPAFDRRLIDYEEALHLCLSHVTGNVAAETVSLIGSLGRILRQNVESGIAVPPFNKSMMDGYALKADDVRQATAERPVRLEVIDEVPAGSVSRKTVKSGQAIRIMTGAPVPEGADAVIIIEHTLLAEGGHVLVNAPAGDNNYIINKGQDILAGDRIAAAGETVTAVLMGVLASCGITAVDVSRRVKIGIISTGSELVSPGTAAREGQIYDINGFSLLGLTTEAGAEATFLGVVRDKSDDLLQVLNNARHFDIILLSGGVSVGDYDIVHETLQRADVQEIFWRVKVKPGKPLFFGKMGDALIFGLPGNPFSSVNNFYLFVRPVMDKFSGKTRWGLETGQAPVANSMILQPGRRKFLRGQLRLEADGCRKVWIIPEQRSGVFSPMTRSDVLVEVPEDRKMIKEGDVAKIYYL
ncbi:MAG: gephyrin-like molybdotransferase Glp [Thermodesulfobacteriota bacterium]